MGTAGLLATNLDWNMLENRGAEIASGITPDDNIPRKIEEIQGPRQVLFGGGIEYILPRGFPRQALVLPWPVEVE